MHPIRQPPTPKNNYRNTTRGKKTYLKTITGAYSLAESLAMPPIRDRLATRCQPPTSCSLPPPSCRLLLAPSRLPLATTRPNTHPRNVPEYQLPGESTAIQASRRQFQRHPTMSCPPPSSGEASSPFSPNRRQRRLGNSFLARAGGHSLFRHKRESHHLRPRRPPLALPAQLCKTGVTNSSTNPVNTHRSSR